MAIVDELKQNWLPASDAADFRKGSDFQGNGNSYKTYGISHNWQRDAEKQKRLHHNQIEVYGDEVLRDRILAFLTASPLIDARALALEIVELNWTNPESIEPDALTVVEQIIRKATEAGVSTDDETLFDAWVLVQEVDIKLDNQGWRAPHSTIEDLCNMVRKLANNWRIPPATPDTERKLADDRPLAPNDKLPCEVLLAPRMFFNRGSSIKALIDQIIERAKPEYEAHSSFRFSFPIESGEVFDFNAKKYLSPDREFAPYNALVDLRAELASEKRKLARAVEALRSFAKPENWSDEVASLQWIGKRHAIEYAEAILSDIGTAPAEAEGDGWLPIETAPKDGTPVMLGWDHGSFDPTKGSCEGGIWGELQADMSFAPYPDQPTHYKPLMASPRQAQRPKPEREG